MVSNRCPAITWTNGDMFDNWTPRHIFQWNFNQISDIFIQDLHICTARPVRWRCLVVRMCSIKLWPGHAMSGGNHWSLGMDKYYHPTLYKGCNYLSVLNSKLTHVSKRPLVRHIHVYASVDWAPFFSTEPLSYDPSSSGSIGTNFSKIWTKIWFSFKKMNF